MVTCQKVIRIIEQFAPKELASEWDNVGLQVGHPSAEINSILVTLDVTEAVIDEAINLGAGMIVSHHPLIFKPLKNLRYDSAVGNLIAKAIQANIGIYAAHTNADSCNRGVNHCLAQKIGLEDIRVLQPEAVNLFKFIVFVPEGYQTIVREAMGEAGAGWIGAYSHCTFMTEGMGSFKPLAGANPFIGKPGQLEEVHEYRVESIVPESKISGLVKKVLEVHPYEEVAYDIYPLVNSDSDQGMGRIGKLPSSLSLGALAEKIKSDLNCPWVLISGSKEAVVETVAVCGGSGAQFIASAKAKGAEVLVTGDVKYHEAMTAKELGINIIDAGHNATERVFISELADYLRNQLNSAGEKVEVFETKIDTNPWDSLIG